MTPRRILVGGWLVFVLYAYPGYLMRDGADQLVDSRYGQFTDWYSPMLTEVWRLVEHLIGGPAGMLFVQSLLLLCGTYSLVRRVLDDRLGAWVAVAVLLVPPVIATHAVICAEAQLAAWLVAGFALLQSDRFGRRLGGLALLVVAAGMRAGGPVATLVVIASTFEWRVPLVPWKRVAVALGAWIAVVALAAGINYALVDDRTQRPQIRMAMNDIVGILDRAPTIDDARARQLLGDVALTSPDGIQAKAKAIYGKDGSYAAGDKALFVMPTTQAERDALFTARLTLVQAYPAAYIGHRWHTFTRTLGFRRPSTWNPVYTRFVATDGDMEALHHAGHHSLVQRILIAPVKALRNTPLFRPIWFGALAIVLLGLAIWRKRRLEIVLLATALAYEIILMFAETSVEYRDSHLMIVLVLMAAFTMLARLRLKTAE